MAFRHGKYGAFTLNTKDLQVYIDNIDFTVDVEEGDTTTMGTTWKSALPGIPSGKLELSGKYDPTVTVSPGAVFWAAIAGGVPVTGLLYPGGNVSPQELWTITTGCLVTSYSESSPVGGVITWKGSIDIVALPVRTNI